MPFLLLHLAALCLAQAPSCASCHPAQARGQQRSLHASAASPGLLGQLPTSGPHRGAGLACLLCHAPAPDQQPWRLAPGAHPVEHPGLDPIESLVAELSGPLPLQANPGFRPEAQREGVGCQGCHLRGGEVLAAPGHPISAAARAAHPVRVDPGLTQPEFCAGCHQFSPASAVNGKPLENTRAELADSLWGRSGATCQGCHLPGGDHRMQGIHSPDLVAASVEVQLQASPGAASGELSLSNEAVGHAFPSYTTPRVLLQVWPEAADGRPLGPPAVLELSRRVRPEAGGWIEESDTRVLPRQAATLHFDFSSNPAVRQLRARVQVEPDFAYLALYQALLDRGGLPPERTAQLRAALARAAASPYPIFEEVRPVAPPAAAAPRKN